MRRTITVLAAAAAAATTLSTTATAEPPKDARATSTTAHLTGWARQHFPAPGNNVQVRVNAHAKFTSHSPFYPVRSWGTFRIYHSVEQPDGKPPLVNWGEFKVDCLTQGGPTATVTGILVRSAKYWKDQIGTRSGVSFYVPDNAPGRVGLAGGTKPGEPLLTKCMAPAADSKIIEGGYHIKKKGPLAP